jgi:outer membrane immunogenic protein
MRNVFLAAAALTLIAAPAMAQSISSPDFRGSIGYTQLDGDDGDLGAITGRLGANFNRYVGVEGEVSFGVADDDFNLGGVQGTVEHEYDAAAYAVGTLPVNPNVELFGRVGYGTTQIETSIPGASVTTDGESVNYGAGANWFIDGRNGVRADWTRRDFSDDNGGELDTYGVSYVRRF